MAFEVERIIDANVNRLIEGLRVVEDLLRFDSLKTGVSKKIKSLRHEITAQVEKMSLIENRKAQNDAGRLVTEKAEYDRSNIIGIYRANFKRAQEACRVIEEVSKLNSISLAKYFESLRYKLYDIEQEVVKVTEFPSQCLYALVTKSLCKKDPLDIVKMIRDGGADILQLREKEMEDGDFFEWSASVVKELKGSDTKLIINDRVHIAQLLDVQGVHLGQGDLPLKEVRKILKPWQWVGRSTSAIEVAQQAEEEGHDYIGVGPLFLTPTKKHRKAVGLEYIKEVNKSCGIPYVAIGAVNRNSVDEILKFKPRGIAICTGIIASEDPLAETKYFKQKIKAIF